MWGVWVCVCVLTHEDNKECRPDRGVLAVCIDLWCWDLTLAGNLVGGWVLTTRCVLCSCDEPLSLLILLA